MTAPHAVGFYEIVNRQKTELSPNKNLNFKNASAFFLNKKYNQRRISKGNPLAKSIVMLRANITSSQRLKVSKIG